jgi:hypothetical protein
MLSPSLYNMLNSPIYDIPWLCRLCHEILPKRSRRTICGDTFGISQQLSEVLGYVPHVQDGISRYVCGFCFTKLNKLSKIDYDILHRVESLRAEKYDMIKTLRSNYLSKFQSCQSKVPSPDVSTSMTNRAIFHDRVDTTRGCHR